MCAGAGRIAAALGRSIWLAIEEYGASSLCGEVLTREGQATLTANLPTNSARTDVAPSFAAGVGAAPSSRCEPERGANHAPVAETSRFVRGLLGAVRLEADPGGAILPGPTPTAPGSPLSGPVRPAWERRKGSSIAVKEPLDLSGGCA